MYIIDRLVEKGAEVVGYDPIAKIIFKTTLMKRTYLA